MRSYFICLLTFSIFLLILSNTYKIYLKPKILPFLLPCWFTSFIILLISTYKDKERIYYDKYISFSCIILVIHSYFNWRNNTESNIIESSLSEPSSIIFICLLSKIFLKTKITKIRISAIFIILIGFILPILFSSKNISNINYKIVLKHIFVNFIFSLLNMFYEIKIKKRIKNIFSFFFTSNLLIFSICTIFLFFEYFMKNIQNFNFLKDKKVYFICLLESYSCIFNFVLVYLFKPVPRTLLRLLISLLCGLYEGIFLINSIKSVDIFSFLIVAFGVLLYNTDYFKCLIIKRKKRKKIERSICEEFERKIADSGGSTFS